MGKFPGKLTRNSRKRISVRQSEAAVNIGHPDVLFQDEGNKISLGLDIFHDLFGRDEEVIEDFKGFSREEVHTSITETRKQTQLLQDLYQRLPKQDGTNSDCKPVPTTSALLESFEQSIDLFYSYEKSDNTENVPKAKPGRPRNQIVKESFKTVPRPGPKPTRKSLYIPTGRPRGRPKHPSSVPTQTKVPIIIGEGRSLKKFMAKKLLQKAKKSSNIHSVTNTSGTNEDLQQDKGGIAAVRKFILPSRSAHSSRVIKPTKRCLESEEVLNEPRSLHSQSSLDTDTRKSTSRTVVLKEPKLILASKSEQHSNVTPGQQSEYKSGNSPSNSSIGTKFGGFDKKDKHNTFQTPTKDNLSAEGRGRWKPTYKVQVDLHDLNVFGAGTSKFSEKQSRIRSLDSKSRPTVSQCDGRQTSPLLSSTKASQPASRISETDSSKKNDVNDAPGVFSGLEKEIKDTNGKSAVNNKLSVPVLPCTTPTCPSPNKSLTGKVVLREARLQLDSKSNSGSETTAPNVKSNPSMPGTVICGVCGAVRFYKFVKQARKFGIFCCESCRKFISKMMGIQKVISKPPVLKCLGGDVEGFCKTVPIVRSHQWKSKSTAVELRSVYKARCPACWLKNCLRIFKMPDVLHKKLSKMLPITMRSNAHGNISDYESEKETLEQETPVREPETDETLTKRRRTIKKKVLFSYDTTFSTPKAKSKEDIKERVKGSTSKSKDSVVYKGNFKENTEVVGNKRIREKMIKEGKIYSKLVKESKLGKVSSKSRDKKVESHKKKNSMQQHKVLEKASKKLLKSSIKQVTKKQKGSEKASNRKKKGAHHTPGADSMRRQRLEMKGPRVKHVCRSASVVLGQPQAIFPKVEKVVPTSLPVSEVLNTSKKASKGSYCQDCDKNSKVQECTHINVENNQDTGSKKCVGVPDVTKITAVGNQVDDVPSSSTSRKINKAMPAPPVVRSMQIPRKLPHQEVKSLVSIDFWESYDPEEVTNSGFGLIGSEPFHTRAICFLCGSAGLEKLIHCASCCDPYHRFCLYDGLRDPTMSLKNSKDEWRLDWLCQRCSVCHMCGLGSGPQLSCQRCRRTYHMECLGTGMSRLHSHDRPWLCSACLRCNSCGQNNVTQYVGNLPFCTPCFKLRKKGNYCPLCQKCYEDDDFDTKMMECGQCKCWVHAKCEDISDEKYLLLGFLPESVEFVCRMCCALAPWRATVEDVLKAGLKGVLQVLVKKCKSRRLLSLSPKKHCSCQFAGGSKHMRLSHHNEDSTCELSDTVDVKPEIQLLNKENLENDSKDLQMVSQRKLETTFTNETKTYFKSGVEITMKDIGTDTEERMDTASDHIASMKNEKIGVENNVSEVSMNEVSKQILPSGGNVDVTGEQTLQSTFDQNQEKDSGPSKVDQCDIDMELNSKATALGDDLTEPLKQLRDKYNLKDCSVCVEKLDKGTQHSDLDFEDKGVELLDSTFSDCSGRSPEKLNSSLTPTDSGIGSTDDELKLSTSKNIRVYAPTAEVDYSSGTCEELSTDVECNCLKTDLSRPTLLSLEKKVDDNEFSSILQFDEEMERLLNGANCSDLVHLYHRKLKDIFPWFDPKHDRTSRFQCLLEQQTNKEEVREETLNTNLNTYLEDVWVMPEYALGRSVNYYYSDFTVEDVRACALCRNVGDGLPCEEGRLLYCGQNEWAHANCALWSSEVFEEIDGSLQNVHSAVFRGRKLTCESCGVKGASVGCCSRNCFVTYHFPCARKSGCRFMEDKTFYCPAHMKEAIGKAVQNHEEFDLRRPIYVELDRKKKKFVEPDKVKFMIGSLCVERLGTVIPGVSDHEDAIIPNDFRCTRLYWSSVEPWRIVQYTVKTILPKVKCEPGVDHGKNITINHELDQWLVRHKLEEVNEWHRNLKKLSNGMTTESKLSCRTEDEKIVRQVMDYMLDAVCSRDVYENYLSDPQNAAELLPPELKDAIFEDLPHDLLDGISMQDIFPKLMSFEDCFGSDAINECKEHLSEEAMLNSEVEENTKLHKPDMHTSDSEIWFSDSKDVDVKLHHDSKREPRKITKELKRSQSEVISLPITKTVGTRSHKRSCSLTWSCKLDSSKRRKVQSRVTRSSDVTMDVTIDKSHKLQELRLPEGVLFTLARSTTPVTSVAGTDIDLKESSSNNSRHRVLHQAEEGKENKCLLWHGRSRIAQLDGAAESSSSGSEGGSPLPPDERGEEKPVRCSRCHSTYRTRISYERHLPTCSNDFILSTSESDSETRSSEGDVKKEGEDITGVPSGFQIAPQLEPVKEKNPKATVADDNKAFIFSDVVQNNISPPATFEQPGVSVPEPVNDIDMYDGKEVAIRSQPKAKYTYQRTGRPRGRPKNAVKQCANIVTVDNAVSATINHSMISQAQTLPPQSIVQPTVIVQQVPSANMMPAFVESFQQQTGHSLQYIASIDIQSNAFTKPQYITNGLIPGTFQLQSTPDYSNLSLLPGVQIASQPAMLGTIIQQPTTAIQCGVVAQDQIVLGSTPLEVYTDQTGGMFLANQPVYYGLETIVSNTVMSSSQYVSGMPGMVAASSSYSATTTQVYQTNKIEPIIDPSSGFVIVPNSQLPNPNLNNCPSSIPLSLPSNVRPQPQPRVQQPQPRAQQPQPRAQPRAQQPHLQRTIISHSQPTGSSQNLPWVPTCNVRKSVPVRATIKQQLARPPMSIHRPRPCYMPNPTIAKTTNFQPPTRLKASFSIANSSTLDRLSSFKNINSSVVHINKNSENAAVRVKQVPMTVQLVSKAVSKPPVVANCISNKDARELGEPKKPAVGVEKASQNSQQALDTNRQLTDNNKHKTQSIRLVLQKTPQNGFYRISQHVPHGNVTHLTCKPTDMEGNKDYKQSSQTKPVNGTFVLPLADNVKTNKSTKQMKRRWQPKEKPNSQPKPSPPCKMVYEVYSKDGFSCTSTSISEVWEKVFEAVQSARIQHKMPPLLRNPFNVNSRGLQMLGLNHNGFRYLVEQLPGVNRCDKYKPIHHELNPPVLDDDDVDTLPEENPSGCCRTEPFKSRAPYDLFSWLASRHRQPPKLISPADELAVSNRRASSTNLPMAMRFRHLKETSKEAVGVYRSHIHGRGLFCLRDIEAGEMVIEYAGEVIRSTLTDYREKLYNDKDIGCYMFRIDDHLVVDATMRGNAARFINHSCEPNCYSKVVDILGKKHILIFALRRIPQGEELTYDYKFPFEDIKIPCTCGSRRCRKYLN